MNPGPPPKTARALPIPLAIAFCFSFAGCDLPETVEITETREISIHDPQPDFDVSEEDRLSSAKILSILPEGWSETAGGQSRLLSFTVGENNTTEVYLSVLQSSDNSDFITPNINRWRTQMGQEPLTKEEIDALPEISLFTQPAKKVIIDGSFTPVGANKPEHGYRLVGAILQIPNFTFFVKMTGPVPEVEAEEDRFDEFTSTLKFR